ncbi:hypothetical protein RDI58_000903 [Solanum bulbocastanum]|uniref:Uncharacterized protein n=1 Tax=Solanum bulbocastanum TaxID=147425 RepID=A0AAN8U420_SOLBU
MKKPEMGKIKANTYASFIHENSRAGIGGIIRDATALYVTRWCKQGGYNKNDLEFDSMIVANMIKDKDTKILKMKRIIQDIDQAMNGAEVNIPTAIEKPTKQLTSLLNRPLQVEVVPSIILFINSLKR